MQSNQDSVKNMQQTRAYEQPRLESACHADAFYKLVLLQA
jgi:hypothetical protein